MHVKGFLSFPMAYHDEDLESVIDALAGFSKLVQLLGHLAADQFPHTE